MAESFFVSFVTIIISELGDKTFIIAAVMAMKNNRKLVLLGAAGALALMTILSVAFGMILPQLLSKRITTLLSALLFLIFGLKMIHEYFQMKEEKTMEEIELVRAEIQQVPGVERASSMEMGVQINQISSSKYFNPILVQVFSMTFFAEWGDRSQITTIALAASHNILAVTFGAILGHFICSALAVLGGQLLASKISVKKGISNN